ncbi:MAG TPA: hypothetical protein VFK82_02520 [Burkholderiaceae bacterium]|nr:hypothetical protein [Burkholderiaceae bacterium]
MNQLKDAAMIIDTPIKPAITVPARLGVTDLPSLLTQDGMEWLTFDCFDTLVWRRTATPSDAFFEMEKHPVHRKYAVSAEQRRMAESMARKKRLLTGSHEVSLLDIYREAAPNASESAHQELARAELEVEKSLCFAFKPILDLAIAARAKGLRTAIISDIYFDSHELDELISHCIGRPANEVFEHVIASSDFGTGKTGKLFTILGSRWKAKPASWMHIGDNTAADHRAPRDLGIHGVLFDPFTDQLREVKRLELAAGNVFDTQLRVSKPTPALHSAVFAGQELSDDEAEWMGFGSVGPALIGLLCQVAQRARALRAEGRTARICFLMRDGHLPKLMAQAMAEAGDEAFSGLHSCALEISRFTAYAASFHSESSIRSYLAEFASSRRYLEICRQLLLSDETTLRVLKTARACATEAQMHQAVIDQLLSPAVVSEITKASEAFARRQARHVQHISQCAPGDVLLFVDLGYAGTVQRLAAPHLQQRLGIEVEGHYLALRNVMSDGNDNAGRRIGVIDARLHDYRAVDSLINHIALMEQFCTSGGGSVIDYREQGQPIRKQSKELPKQHEIRVRVQRGACAFAQAAVRRWADMPAARPTPEEMATASAMALARLVFLPSEAEVRLVEGFSHDVNLGAEDKIEFLDRELARTELRQRGLNYVGSADRIFIPAELRTYGLDASMLHFAQSRFRLGFNEADLGFDRVPLTLMISMRGEVWTHQIEANATREGFYRALVPAGAQMIGLLLGEHYNWVQIECVRVALPHERNPANTAMTNLALVADRATVYQDGLVHFETPSGFLLADLGEFAEQARYVEIVFRPISRRAA